MVDLRKILACPKCQTKLNPQNRAGHCPHCRFAYKFEDGIWELLYITDKSTKKSLAAYDKMHRKIFDGPTDGSYEILSAIARGNLAVDIACGDGFIEKFSPETVAVEFSQNALANAQKKGAKYLVLADAHHLPFVNNAFELAISSGNLEQFANPKKAIQEMVRIAKIQVIVAHREFNFPLASLFRNIVSKIVQLEHQPIEKPLKTKALEKMIEKAGARVIYKGVWTIPVNHGRVIKFLPEFKNIPACSFFVSIKK